jgi:hypothetical protein
VPQFLGDRRGGAHPSADADSRDHNHYDSWIATVIDRLMA